MIAEKRHEAFEGTSRVMEIAIFSQSLNWKGHIEEVIRRSIHYQSKKSRDCPPASFWPSVPNWENKFIVDLRYPFQLSPVTMRVSPTDSLEVFFRRPLSVRNGEPFSPTFMIGHLNLPKKLDPFQQIFRICNSRIFLSSWASRFVVGG